MTKLYLRKDNYNLIKDEMAAVKKRYEGIMNKFGKKFKQAVEKSGLIYPTMPSLKEFLND